MPMNFYVILQGLIGSYGFNTVCNGFNIQSTLYVKQNIHVSKIFSNENAIIDTSSRKRRGSNQSFITAHSMIFRKDQDDKVSSNKRQRRKLEGKLPILSRIVDIGTKEIPNITIWEMEKPSELISMWWTADIDITNAIRKDQIGDPFGIVMWPGSILASREMVKYKDQVKNKTVLILGAGTGVEAQAAALLGASKVIATDVNKMTLKLLNFGAENAGVGDIIECKAFDLFSDEKLPECDIVVAADVLYNVELANCIGERCLEILLTKDGKSSPKLIVTDSQRFHGTDFLTTVNQKIQSKQEEDKNLQYELLTWEEQILHNVTGSGVVIAEDQTYDAKTRILSLGW